ncbi:MAG TPA: hypothetical protein VFK80_06280 [Limnochordia bacterium]|nr:hypothetical protein [Limnochordia bacterium]
MPNTLQQLITPGPCPPEGCPPPTDIECIEVRRVYDLCFQQDTMTRTFTVRGADARCLCEGENCTVGTMIPTDVLREGAFCEVVNRVQQSNGFAVVTLRVHVPIAYYTVGTTLPTTQDACFVRNAVFTKTVTLCAPLGTDIDCSVTGAATSMITDINDGAITIETTASICVVIKSTADVNLLVPTYGFCVPAECVTAGLGPCPPVAPPFCAPPTLV